MRIIARVVVGLVGVALLAMSGAPAAHAVPLLANGDFETGTFTAWMKDDLMPGSGTFFIDTPGSPTPVSSHPTIGNGSNWYAVSDQNAPGTHALRQKFTVPTDAVSVILRFDMFVNDWDAGPIINPIGLDHRDGPNQHARVDLLSAGAGAFDTGAGVLRNFYLGVDPGPDPHPFTSYVFDITPQATPGGTYQIRFADTETQFFLNLGVDNVSIEAQIPAPASVPAPASLALVLAGLAGMGGLALRRSPRR